MITKSSRISLSDKDFITAIARASVQGLVTVPHIAAELKTATRTVGLRLGRLEAKGWVRRVKRGVYFILPLEASKRVGGVAGDPWVVASALFAPCYIGGWSAAEHWELTEQLFRSTFVVTAANARASKQTILGNEYRIARVSKDRISGFTTVWRGNIKVTVADRERTLIDALANPAWVGGFRHLADMLETYLASNECNVAKLVKDARALGRGAVCKRLGFLLERYDPSATRLLAVLRRSISPAPIKLDPSVLAKGKLNSIWGVLVNVTLE